MFISLRDRRTDVLLGSVPEPLRRLIQILGIFARPFSLYFPMTFVIICIYLDQSLDYVPFKNIIPLFVMRSYVTTILHTKINISLEFLVPVKGLWSGIDWQSFPGIILVLMYSFAKTTQTGKVHFTWHNVVRKHFPVSKW